MKEENEIQSQILTDSDAPCRPLPPPRMFKYYSIRINIHFLLMLFWDNGSFICVLSSSYIKTKDTLTEDLKEETLIFCNYFSYFETMGFLPLYLSLKAVSKTLFNWLIFSSVLFIVCLFPLVPENFILGPSPPNCHAWCHRRSSQWPKVGRFAQ